MTDFPFACSFVGNLLKGQTVGVIGAGRIGSAYARMMVSTVFNIYIYIPLFLSLVCFIDFSLILKYIYIYIG